MCLFANRPPFSLRQPQEGSTYLSGEASPTGGRRWGSESKTNGEQAASRGTSAPNFHHINNFHRGIRPHTSAAKHARPRVHTPLTCRPSSPPLDLLRCAAALQRHSETSTPMNMHFVCLSGAILHLASMGETRRADRASEHVTRTLRAFHTHRPTFLTGDLFGLLSLFSYSSNRNSHCI